MTELLFRDATYDDLEAIVAMLADDPWGRGRERTELPLDRRYGEAFAAIAASPDQRLVVAERDGAVVGTLQLTFIRNFSHLGALSGQIEGVRIVAGQRGAGLGRHLLSWAIDACRVRGCTTVQLTTTAARVDAQRFYAGLGFTPSHVGMKLTL